MLTAAGSGNGGRAVVAWACLPAATAAEYDLRFRTAGVAAGMAARIAVNGVEINSGLPRPVTGSASSNWQAVVQPAATLQAGSNMIRFQDSGVDQPNWGQLELLLPG